jgi:pyruvate dehydrogenase E1 component alpha subunit
VLEAKTYRLAPHIWWDKAAYQPAAEIDTWRELDPVLRARGALVKLGTDDRTLDAVRVSATKTVEDALSAAFAAPAASWESANEWVTP